MSGLNRAFSFALHRIWCKTGKESQRDAVAQVIETCRIYAAWNQPPQKRQKDLLQMELPGWSQGERIQQLILIASRVKPEVVKTEAKLNDQWTFNIFGKFLAQCGKPFGDKYRRLHQTRQLLKSCHSIIPY
jgi:hypothetical protein